MSASNYDDALRRLLAHEGGYSNHPSDPGGPTKFGITLAVYRQAVKPRATVADVKAMTVDEAKAIYRFRYWDAQRCDELPSGVDYAVFDYGVNSGIGRSVKALQRIAGVADDGALGPITLAAVRKAEPRTLVNAICDERLRFLQSVKTWNVFGKGWGRRVSEVRTAALAMVAAPPAAPAQTVASAGALAAIAAWVRRWRQAA
jgi:lysozyme family protein